eukprot:TRINITY_DN63795_c0_g1_i1.p2 TRINITY_DN63795_c0_g1~~TRINITY_DN63795_c0_g1_i1.p2  ORF type:complete len:168 (-),score=45.32 TRINITY_DN63795_c0_g1_i1:164-667(-)
MPASWGLGMFFTLLTLLAATIRGELISEKTKADLLEDGFLTVDLDSDDQLSLQELVSYAKSEIPDVASDAGFVQDVRGEFAKFDHDKSGTLSKAEFLEMLSSQQLEDEVEEGDDEEKDDEEADDEEDDGEEDDDKEDDEDREDSSHDVGGNDTEDEHEDYADDEDEE